VNHLNHIRRNGLLACVWHKAVIEWFLYLKLNWMYHELLNITYKCKVISLVTSCLLQYSTLTLNFKRLKRKRLPIKWQNHPQTIVVIFFYNPFTPRVRYRDIKVWLLSLWMKSFGVTIQMKPRQQYFHMVLFIFISILQSEIGIHLEFWFKAAVHQIGGSREPLHFFDTWTCCFG